MKFLLHICLVVTALAVFSAGCARAPHYNALLVQADSLMKADMPDSALSLLSSISPESLTSSGDNAFYALLITEARYKCYKPFTSDSEINMAVNYYEHHNKEHNKLTRSYLYKGAVIDELTKSAVSNKMKKTVDSAMIYYKRAEVNAIESKDFFNQGYANLRMGKLYSNHHAFDGRDIEKLVNALDCFRKHGNTHYQMICMKELGALYRSKNANDAEAFLTDAISLAEKEKDTTHLIGCLHDLAYAYFMRGDENKSWYMKAYDLLARIKSLRQEGLDYKIYTTSACVYAKLGMPDSAMIYLKMAEDVNHNIVWKSNYLEAKSHVALARGDSLNFWKISHECDRMTFAALNDPDIVNIMNTELDFDSQHRTQIERKRHTDNLITASIVATVILLLLLLALLMYRRSHRYDKLVVELKDQSQSQMNDLMGLQGNISEMKIQDERLKSFISSHMGMMREMIEACYHEPNNRIAENMKRIVKFQDSNKNNWVKLYDYIDMEHNNIMTVTQQRYPQLDDRDLLLLALTSLGFSYIQTAIIMGYSNATSVSVIKQRLAKKMGLDESLNDYIKRFNPEKKTEQA